MHNPITNRIDFVAFISATNANPNGDPNFGNRPRTDSMGFGEITDVCIKRKIRNRMQNMGESIFYQSAGDETDNAKSLSERFSNLIGSAPIPEAIRIVLDSYIDNRLFGAMFAYKGNKGKGKGGKKSTADTAEDGDETAKESTSIGLRAPVTINVARTISPVNVTEMGITKSMNGETTKDGRKGPDTMGTKNMVEHGLYKVCGSICSELMDKVYFDENGQPLPNRDMKHDLDVLKEAIISMFVDDASSARPAGSMEVVNLYWFTHNSNRGVCNQRKVFNSVKATPIVENPVSPDDYTFDVSPIENIDCEVIAGF